LGVAEPPPIGQSGGSRTTLVAYGGGLATPREKRKKQNLEGLALGSGRTIPKGHGGGSATSRLDKGVFFIFIFFQNYNMALMWHLEHVLTFKGCLVVLTWTTVNFWTKICIISGHIRHRLHIEKVFHADVRTLGQHVRTCFVESLFSVTCPNMR
jgi:hypothetical protein